MDFLKILKSFEDFVYEALTWLILLPRTLLRIVASPRRMVSYAEQELASSDEERFGDAISPPLLLILCVLMAQLFDLALRSQAPIRQGSLASALLASEEYLLLYRTIAFGVWALAGAAIYLTGARQPIDRKSLRSPFYEHCYLAAPFALVLSMGVSLSLGEAGQSAVGACLVLVALLWFWGVQVDWFRYRMAIPLWRSVLAATLVLLVGGAINALVGAALQNIDATPGAPVEAGTVAPAA